MSYILDALRRAEAERGLGRAPDLHAQPLRPAAADDTAGAVRGRPLAWLAGGLLLGLVGALLAWRLVPRGAALDVPLAPADAPAAVVSATPPAPPAAAVPRAAPAAEAPPVAALPPLPAPTPPAVAAAARPPAPRAAPAAAPSLPAYAELPEALRRDLPPLRVGGSVHSDEPSARLLILDGRVLREGDALAPGLVVERIGPRSAVLRWRDQAFTLPY